jgi:uncharacterized protein with PIN domain
MRGRSTAEFRFYAELNDFLPATRKFRPFPVAFDGRPAVKDPIEALGVPHTEVDLVLVNGRSVPFSHRLGDGDRVAVYPCFEALAIEPAQRLRARPLRRPAFVLDVHLGRLARLLRLCGFDALYRNDLADDEIVAISLSERRIILTRDRGLLFRRAITHGCWVRATAPLLQLREIVERLDLAARIRPFARCAECNGIIRSVPKARVADRLPPRVREAHRTFRQCGGCGRVYWKGSHHERLSARLAALRNDAAGLGRGAPAARTGADGHGR